MSALKILGFEDATSVNRSQRRKKGGTHRTFKRGRAGGGHDVATVPLGKKEIPDGTFACILRQAGVTKKQFREALKKP